MRSAAIAVLSVGALAWSCCASAAPPCPAGLTRQQGVTLYFGGSVPAADWADFAARILTPAFPDGFTAIDAAGQWRSPAGVIVRERSRVVQVFGPAVLAKLPAVTTAYRVRFHQVSVGVVTQEACAAF
jgi:hypothetical protein